MPDGPSEELRELETLIKRRVASDHNFAEIVCSLGRWLMSIATPAPIVKEVESIIASKSPAPEIIATTKANVLEDPATNQDVKNLMSKFSGDVSPKISIAEQPRVAIRPPELDYRFAKLCEMSARMRLKCDACLWIHQRNQIGFDAVKDERTILILRAGEIQPCHLWMIGKTFTPTLKVDWLLLSGFFAACADILEVIREYPEKFNKNHVLFDLACEAQLALRSAIVNATITHVTDLDQGAMFAWCRDEGLLSNRSSSFMSNDDRIAHVAPSDISMRIAAERELLHTSQARQRETSHNLKKISYHIKLLSENPQEADSHWRKIVTTVDAMHELGFSLSEKELVRLFADDDLLESLPQEIAALPNMSELLRYVDRSIAASEKETQPRPSRQWSAEVSSVRSALSGKRLVIIGGDERLHASTNIKAAFSLGELDWVAAKSHTSLDEFTAAISNPKTAVVLLMIRWCSHNYTKLQKLCKELGVPFVRLPGGYNANTIAHEITEQAGEGLGIS